MTTLAENVIVAGADNHPPMLEKIMYNSWQSRMKLYIRGKEHGKDLIDSILNGPFQYGKVVVDGITRPRTYEELTNKEKICEECDIRATNILINDINMIGISMQKLQVNTKFFNNLQPEWSKKHEVHANEVKMMRERFPDPLALLGLGLAVPSFLPDDDLIASLNKAMAFIITVISSCYPTTNNQLRTSSNPRHHATIQDGRVIVQQVQGRHSQSFAGNGTQSQATSTAAQESGIVLDEEQLAFLADPGVA
ncbi:hypothetical protein Tco_0772305 [Tanacetum coccineum]|uniref:Integrase, catalytic region, zinc finger, CCHC-type, peptidase aspartic, catalytic n=1 Tax=Tanacetum coccineum TaxID=301880 RepID=A0ABQ4ZHI0_9ASTR